MNDRTDTTAQERTNLRRQMAVQRQVELSMNSLLAGMAKLVDDSHVAASQMEKHQIKNLLAVALETLSVEAIKHYILYQVGRDVAANSWRRGDFGQTLIKALDNLRSMAERITRDVHEQMGLAVPSAAQIDATWLLLVRVYLGHFNRYFYYTKEATRWQPATP